VRIIGAELLAPAGQLDLLVLAAYVPASRLRHALLRAGAQELAAVPFELRATPRAQLARLAGALAFPVVVGTANGRAAHGYA
jgi:hypothetical protein